jgi:hypothetical protein
MKYNVYEVNIGDCIGNPLGFQGREIWILEAYGSESLELMALEKISNIYNTGKSSIDGIINRFVEEFTKLIDYNSKFLDYKNLLDKAEVSLEGVEKEIDNMKPKEIEMESTDFSINGLLLECFNEKENNSRIIATPDIEDNRVRALNYLLIFNNILEPADTSIPLCKKVFISGYLINNEWKEITLKVETNTDFDMMINNMIVFKKEKLSQTIIANSESINLTPQSLNRIQIVISPIKTLTFKLTILNEKAVYIPKTSDFIPLTPFENYNVKKTDLKDFEVLNCVSAGLTEHTIGSCRAECIQSTSMNICKASYEKGLILKIGGFIGRKHLIYNLIGLDYLITEVKLGYTHEYKALEIDMKNQLNQIYTLNMDKSNIGSFLFYKKEMNPTNILVDIKLACDNSNIQINLPKHYKIEKLHDMINGFTILLVTMSYNDYISHSAHQYIDYIKLGVYNTPIVSDIGANRLICSINEKKVILEYRYKRNDYITNIPNYHSNMHSLADLLKETPQDKETIVKCSALDNNEICTKAMEAGVVPTSLEGVFSIKHLPGMMPEFSLLTKLPTIAVISNSKYKLYNSSIDLLQPNRYTSFLQVSQFYSNDLLTKLEKGLNTVTDKILEQSKKIIEVER